MRKKASDNSSKMLTAELNCDWSSTSQTPKTGGPKPGCSNEDSAGSQHAERLTSIQPAKIEHQRLNSHTSKSDSVSWIFWKKLQANPQKNLSLRLTVLQAKNEERDDWRCLFADGPDGFLCWLNLCGWTFNPRLTRKHIPFITWEIQDAAARELIDAIETGHDVLFDKSRDMGATWLNLAAFVWYWLFKADTPLLVASRKQEYVDASGNPDTLFWKIDYLIDNLPAWLQPKQSRRQLHLGNLENGSVIDGESTNADLGRGGRRKAILLDEFAAVDNGQEILSATADATPCRVFNSTPKGRANAFADVRFSGKVKVITLPWWRHPQKGHDKQEIRLPDGAKKWTSPWYESECARRTSRKEIAQELDIDYLASGEAFFDLDVCQRLRGDSRLRPADNCGELNFKVDTSADARRYHMGDVRWSEDCGKRRLMLWCNLEPDLNARGEMRPPQNTNYAAFCDISNGQGASNSVIKVADATSREEVAAFVCPDTPPHDLAHYAVAICRWFGGANGDTYLGWEANGPGGIFGKEVYRLGYPCVLGNTNPAIPWEPADSRIGWYSNREKKENLLGELRKAMARDELIIHDEATITEAEQYVYFPSGSIGPASLTAETGGARAAHGDRVIASAGLLLCLRHQTPARLPANSTQPDSFAHRKRLWKRQKTNQQKW